MTLPSFVFDVTHGPFYNDSQPLNNDPSYQKRVISHMYLRLVEKWLYKDSEFRRLLKYFTVTQDVDKNSRRVSLITNMDKASSSNVDAEYRRHVFRYIENVFVTRRLVDKTLRKYVRRTDTNWYDLFSDRDAVIHAIAKNLERLIRSTVYEIEGRTDRVHMMSESASEPDLPRK